MRNVEVACWYHARRRFWEAAVAKSEVAREGLMRIDRIFELDDSWKKKPPAEIAQRRKVHLRPHVLAFFAWVETHRPAFEDQRGLVRTALEYAHNHCVALQTFFEDGRLVLTNNVRKGVVREDPGMTSILDATILSNAFPSSAVRRARNQLSARSDPRTR